MALSSYFKAFLRFFFFFSLSLFFKLDAKASLRRLRQKCFEVTEEEIRADGAEVAARAHHLQVRGVVEAVAMATIEISGTRGANSLSSSSSSVSPAPPRHLTSHALRLPWRPAGVRHAVYI